MANEIKQKLNRIYDELAEIASKVRDTDASASLRKASYLVQDAIDEVTERAVAEAVTVAAHANGAVGDVEPYMLRRRAA